VSPGRDLVKSIRRLQGLSRNFGNKKPTQAIAGTGRCFSDYWLQARTTKDRRTCISDLSRFTQTTVSEDFLACSEITPERGKCGLIFLNSHPCRGVSSSGYPKKFVRKQEARGVSLVKEYKII